MQSFRRAAKQSGQAIAEFVVVATFLLIPLFLLIPVVAKIISLSQDNQVAARYAAWERTIWYGEDPPEHINESAAGSGQVVRSDTRLARDIDARVLSADDTPVVSSAGVGFSIDPFSRNPNDSSSAMLENSGTEALPEYSSLASDEDPPPGLTGDMNDFVDAIGSITDFDLNTDGGLFTANVTLPLIDFSRLFGFEEDTFPLSLSATNAIFAEAWEAGGTRHAKHLVGGLTIQQYGDAGPVRALQNAYAHLPFGEELDDKCLVMGYASVESVPEHRLSDFKGLGVKGVGDEAGCGL